MILVDDEKKKLGFLSIFCTELIFVSGCCYNCNVLADLFSDCQPLYNMEGKKGVSLKKKNNFLFSYMT